MAGNVGRGVRSQKNCRAFQVMVATKTVKRNLGQEGLGVVLKNPTGHVRGKPARRDGVDLDIVWRPFARQIFGEGDDPTFTGVVADGLELRGSSAQARHRGHVNDLALALPDHGFAYGLREQESSREV